MKSSSPFYKTQKLIVCLILLLMPLAYSCPGGGGTPSGKDTAMTPTGDTINRGLVPSDTVRNSMDTGGKGNQNPPPPPNH